MLRKFVIGFALLALAGCQGLPDMPKLPGFGKKAAVEDAAPMTAGSDPAVIDSKAPLVVGPGADAGADVFAQKSPVELPPVEEGPSLDDDMEDIKQALVELKRDLVVLEEDLHFPASSQVSVFLSMDIGDFFQLDAVTLKVNGEQVAHHLYTERQVDALYRGGVQQVYLGNVRQGDNEITAFFTGRGPSGRDYRRAATIPFEKSFEPVFVELKISDSLAKYQPDFEAFLSE